MDLQGKVALITGGGRGLGKAMALGFAQEGADVIICSRTIQEIESVANEIRSLSGKALCVKTDVSKEDEVRNLADSALKEFGRIDVLINNAGINMPRPVTEVTDLTIEAWDRMISINLRGPFLCTKAFLPSMIDRESGSIINISSGMAKRGRAGFAPYNASKFGLEGFTQALAEEVKQDNIAVNSLSPGGLVITGTIKPEYAPPGRRMQILSPEVIVPSAIFLASQDASGVTGQYIDALDWNIEHKLGNPEKWSWKK